MTVLEDAIRRHPGDHGSRFELVRLVAATGDCERTLRIAVEGVRLHPVEPVYPFFVADCLVRLGRAAEARPWLGRLLAMDGVPLASRRHAEDLLQRLGTQ